MIEVLIAVTIAWFVAKARYHHNYQPGHRPGSQSEPMD